MAKKAHRIGLEHFHEISSHEKTEVKETPDSQLYLNEKKARRSSPNVT